MEGLIVHEKHESMWNLEYDMDMCFVCVSALLAYTLCCRV